MTTPRFFRPKLFGAVATALLTVAPVIQAADNVRYDDVSYSTMIIDAAVARPLGFGATVVGTAVWIVTLPFSALGGNVRDAADVLVVKPARFTFIRPLGEL